MWNPCRKGLIKMTRYREGCGLKEFLNKSSSWLEISSSTWKKPYLCTRITYIYFNTYDKTWRLFLLAVQKIFHFLWNSLAVISSLQTSLYWKNTILKGEFPLKIHLYFLWKIFRAYQLLYRKIRRRKCNDVISPMDYPPY